MEKDLEMTALVVFPPGEGGGTRPHYIREGISDILSSVNGKGEYFDERFSIAKKSCLRRIVYGPVGSKPRREISFKEYLSLSQPQSLSENYFENRN